MKTIILFAIAAFGSYGLITTDAETEKTDESSGIIRNLTMSISDVFSQENSASPIPNDTIYPNASYVDFDRFLALAQKVRDHRAERMVSLDEFNEMSKEENTIILDTRSKAMYNSRHIKGAVHLNFSDFTQLNLARLIPDTNTRILIYCNNNFIDDAINFPTKSISPYERELMQLRSLPNGPKEFPLTMALNVPTYINLYGYGYKNVYELADLVSIFYGKIEFEGTAPTVSSN